MGKLYEALKAAQTEEDVKDAYIKALGIEAHKGLVDIQTELVWFEAKGYSVPAIRMFTQLFYYVNGEVQKALKDMQGNLFNGGLCPNVPPILCVIDSEKAALMDSIVAVKFLAAKGKTIQWGKSASDVTDEAAEFIHSTCTIFLVSLAALNASPRQTSDCDALAFLLLV